MAETIIIFWQHLPERLDPVAFSVGSLAVRWYSIMYLIGFGVVYWLLIIRKKELLSEVIQKSKIKNQNNNEKLKYKLVNASNIYKKLENEFIPDLLIYCFIGLLIGARLGYVVFYDLAYFIKNPLEIILPFKISCFMLHDSCFIFSGFYGMSYFGGLLGVLVAGYIFSGKRKIDFWQMADFAVPAIPAGYFFGRIGNFLNGELYGRITDQPWGMYFPADPLGSLRHPSQLYEAFFEGLVLFVVLWLLRNMLRSNLRCQSGILLAIYCLGYGIARFGCEFFREPDPQVGMISGLTLGQIFSLLAIILAVCIFIWRRKKKVV